MGESIKKTKPVITNGRVRNDVVIKVNFPESIIIDCKANE